MARRGGAGRGGDGCCGVGGEEEEEEGIGRVDVDGGSSSFVAVVASLSVIVTVFSLPPLTAAATTTAPSSAARGGSSIVAERRPLPASRALVFRGERQRKKKRVEWRKFFFPPHKTSAPLFSERPLLDCSRALSRSNPGSGSEAPRAFLFPSP